MTAIHNASGMPHYWFEQTGYFNQLFDVLVVRGTFDFGLDGNVMQPAAQQQPVVLGDEYDGPVATEPLKAVIRAEGDLLLMKPSTDVHLTGTARSDQAKPLQSWLAGVRVGTLQKVLRLSGPRHFYRGMVGGWRLSDAQNVDAVALDYRLAFGGCYSVPVATPAPAAAGPQAQTPSGPVRTHDYAYKPDNPAGIGWLPSKPELDAVANPQSRKAIAAQVRAVTELAAPQIEGDTVAITDPQQKAAAQGFGPIARWCEPRVSRQGTMDAAWMQTRYPFVPDDFKLSYYNSAPLELTQPAGKAAYLLGNEDIKLIGLLPEGPVGMRLPDAALIAEVTTEDGRRHAIPLNLDTVALNLDRRQCSLTWRTVFAKKDGVRQVNIHTLRTDQWRRTLESAPPPISIRAV
jgi:hypothetical protein